MPVGSRSGVAASPMIQVQLLRDGADRDGSGRLLRYVFVESTFVNADLVWGGCAYARTYGDSLRL